MIALDKLDKIGRDGVARELAERGISAEAGQSALSFFVEGSPASGGPEAALARLDGILPGNEALANLTTIVRLAQSTAAAGRIRVDPSLARGLSYYTGAIMEIAVEGIGSLGGGGRYDNLVGMFLGRDVPACGFSLGLERIIVVMTERQMFPATMAQGAVDVVVTFLDDESRGEAMTMAAELRRQQLRVDVFPDASRKFEKPLKYASARGAQALVIFGENERARGETSIRNLTTREQQSVPRSEAAERVRQLVNDERRTQNDERRT